MSAFPIRLLRTALLACALSATAPPALAQGIEITPFGGYRFGGDFFELLAGQRLDIDGAPSYGVVIDFPTRDGFQIEALFTRQTARVLAPAYVSGPTVQWDLAVEHWQAGGLQELQTGRVRPFLIGSLGATRYATGGDSELRFAFGGGGGVKLFASDRIGVRLTGEIFATFINADARVSSCGVGGICLGRFSATVFWQAEATAGLIIRLPGR